MYKLPEGQQLIPGRFYRSFSGEIWCCFKVDGSALTAHCVNVSSHRVEYFYLDGRYDSKGVRSECLIEDMTTFWDSLRPNQVKG